MENSINQHGPVMSETGKRKKSKASIVIISILLVVVIALAVVLVMFMGNGGVKPDQTFTATNINAGVIVSGKVVHSDGHAEVIEVDGKEKAEISLNAEGKSESVVEHLGFNTNTTLSTSSIIMLYYEFTNNSSNAMYVKFGKEVADDDNYKITIYYRCAEDDLQTIVYYTDNGKYYSTLEDMTNGANAMDTIAMTDGAKVESGTSMTMSIELKVIKADDDANLNCNFAFNMSNEG